MNNELFVITTYYNPRGYRQRLANYLKFAKHLNARLLTVELALGDQRFALQDNDCDILIQVRSNSSMWHKEKLINIGIQELPPSAKYVAWVDCDVVFCHNNWINEAIALMKQYPLIQLFDRLFDLRQHEQPEGFDLPSALPSGYSFAYHHKAGIQKTSLPTSYHAFRFNACGIAWAADIDFIKKHYLYDAMILGSGDRMLAAATTGQFEDAMLTTQLTGKRAQHYLNWAEPFFRDIDGMIGYLPYPVFHLWHGDLQNRGWTERHQKLASYGFNPDRDLRINAMGCWEWNNYNVQMQDYVCDYFANRLEDG